MHSLFQESPGPGVSRLPSDPLTGCVTLSWSLHLSGFSFLLPSMRSHNPYPCFLLVSREENVLREVKVSKKSEWAIQTPEAGVKHNILNFSPAESRFLDSVLQLGKNLGVKKLTPSSLYTWIHSEWGQRKRIPGELKSQILPPKSLLSFSTLLYQGRSD